MGPWTPELLATAISQIDANRSGIDLRTVQLWFQENERGISADNLRWLARVYGCDDPEATIEWQAELSAGQSRLTANRREKRKTTDSAVSEALDMLQPALPDLTTGSPEEKVLEGDDGAPVRGFSLAQRSESILSHPSPLDLPAAVFAGAVALGFLSYLLGVHNVTYVRPDGLAKQVGFIWAPNWTLLFMVLMPLYFAFVVDLLVFWKEGGRLQLLGRGGRMDPNDDWARRVEASSYTYLAVFIFCTAFAGLFQWVGVRLIPLTSGGGATAPDWGFIALEHPDIISVPEAIAFTGLAYLYMCLCFYLFFAGLILLYTLAHDLWKIGEDSSLGPEVGSQSEVTDIAGRVMRGIFRCTILGILIAICMKLQTIYLSSSGETIVAWLLGDMTSVLQERKYATGGIEYNMPTQYSSLLIVISTCVVFLYGSIRLGFGDQFRVPVGRMIVVVALLIAGYLLIGAFAGFSIPLSIGALLAIYGLFDPGFGRGRLQELGGNQNVR